MSSLSLLSLKFPFLQFKKWLIMDLFGLMEVIHTSFECAVTSKKIADIEWGRRKRRGSPTSPDFHVNCSVLSPQLGHKLCWAPLHSTPLHSPLHGERFCLFYHYCIPKISNITQHKASTQKYVFSEWTSFEVSAMILLILVIGRWRFLEVKLLKFA